MSDHPKIRNATTSQLRSWADAHAISSARFADEMERRRKAGRLEIAEAPPLDYATIVEGELDIPLYPHEIRIADDREDDFGAQPHSDLVGWICMAVAILATAGLIALCIWGVRVSGTSWLDML